MGDWDPERCSQDCARSRGARAARVLAERAPAPAPSTKPKRPAPAVARRRPRGHDRGLREGPRGGGGGGDVVVRGREETRTSPLVDDDEAGAGAGAVVGTVRKWDGRRGCIRLEGQASDAVLFDPNVRGGATLRVGDRVEFALRAGKKHPSAVEVASRGGRPVGRPRRRTSCASSTGRVAGSRSRPATGTASRPASIGTWEDPKKAEERSRRATGSTSWPRNRPGTSATGRSRPATSPSSARPAPRPARPPRLRRLDTFRRRALCVSIVGQGKTRIEGGALGLFWERGHPRCRGLASWAHMQDSRHAPFVEAIRAQPHRGRRRGLRVGAGAGAAGAAGVPRCRARSRGGRGRAAPVLLHHPRDGPGGPLRARECLGAGSRAYGRATA